MQQEQGSPNKAQEAQQHDSVRDFLSKREITGIAIAVWSFVGGFFLLRLYIYDHASDAAKASEVLVASMFSLALVIVIVIHAVMYLKQAKAMIAQLQATERNTIYAQRAYVYAKMGEVREDIFDVVLLIENSGNSPANDVRISYKAEFRERDPHKDTKDWDSFHTPRYNPRRIGVLPPKIYFPETILNRPVPTPDELRKYYARHWNYHVWGEIAYRDVFGNEWYTSFAFYVTAVGNSKVTILSGLTGNEAN